MIEQIFTIENFSPKDYCGRKLFALFEAYGAGYDFCRFYRFSGAEKSALLCAFNDSLLIAGEVDLAELSLFVKAVSPAGIELSGEEEAEFDGYKKFPRKIFELCENKTNEDFFRSMKPEENPPLREVYEILKRSFDLPFAAWFTDTSHRIRHEKAKFFRYKSTAVFEQFCVCGRAYYCQLATAPADRGKGQARELLGFLALKARERGIKAELSSEEDRFGFYEEIGAKHIGEMLLFEKAK